MSDIHTNTKKSVFQILKRLPLVPLLSLLLITIATYVLVTESISAQESNNEKIWTTGARGHIANQEGAQVKTSENKWIGTGGDTKDSYLGIIFQGEAIPAGTELEEAKLVLVPDATQWIQVKAKVSSELTPEPEPFSQRNRISQRPISEESVEISDNVKWEAGKAYEYDVTPVIKGRIDSDSTKVSIVIKGNGKPWGRKTIVGRGEYAPKLILKYKSKEQAVVTPPETGHEHHGGTADTSHAYSQWTPTTQDTCTKEIHDSYVVTGPDGKKYPTWHPPVRIFADGSTCTFGHEHGRNPQGSNLMPFIKEHFSHAGQVDSSGIPFGYANEQLDVYNQAKGITDGMRHEDHVGHKIEWENNVPLRVNSCGGPAAEGCFDTQSLNITCDFLTKIHQGTHSKDAFTNNMHELEYFVSCSDGTKVAASKMVMFGKPGEFTANTKDKVIAAGPAAPANAPAGGGARFIPTRETVEQFILVPEGQWSQYSPGLYEDWLSASYIRKPNSEDFLLYFDPHFAVFAPSRFYDPEKADNLGRTTDICTMSQNGGVEKYRGGECDQLTNYGQNLNIAYDDPRSPFNGVKREVYFNQTTIDNAGGPEVWYTDPFGQNASTTEFPGSIKQYISSINNKNRPTLESQAIGGDRNYGGNGVHAPN